MYPINNRQYLKICAEIAKLMSIRDRANLAEGGLSNAGTATEQIAGLGIPSLSLPGHGPQFTMSR